MCLPSNNIAWIVALCALVRFLPSVNEGVGLQITSLTKWLVALWTIELLASTVGLSLLWKAISTRKAITAPEHFPQQQQHHLAWLCPSNVFCFCYSIIWWYCIIFVWKNYDFPSYDFIHRIVRNVDTESLKMLTRNSSEVTEQCTPVVTLGTLKRSLSSRPFEGYCMFPISILSLMRTSLTSSKSSSLSPLSSSPGHLLHQNASSGL